MRYNNNQLIITDEDILVSSDTLSQNQDKSKRVLSDVIKAQNEKITKLTQEIKWLYKHGGTGAMGGGSGQGGSSSRTWEINATLDGQVLTSGGESLKLDNTNNHFLRLFVSGGNDNHTFKGIVRVLDKSGNSLQVLRYNFSEGNRLYENSTLQLDDMGTITIDVTENDTGLGKYISITYRTNPIRVSSLNILSDTTPVTTAFKESLESLNIECIISSFDEQISLSESNPSIKFFIDDDIKDNPTHSFKKTSQTSYQTGTLKFTNLKTLLDDLELGNHVITIELTFTGGGSSLIKTISSDLSIVPSDLYLMVKPLKGVKLFSEEQSEEPDKGFVGSLENLELQLIPYNNTIYDSPANVSYKLNNGKKIAISCAKYGYITPLLIRSENYLRSDENNSTLSAWNSITVYLENLFEKTYWFYVKNSDSISDYYRTDDFIQDRFVWSWIGLKRQQHRGENIVDITAEEEQEGRDTWGWLKGISSFEITNETKNFPLNFSESTSQNQDEYIVNIGFKCSNTINPINPLIEIIQKGFSYKVYYDKVKFRDNKNNSEEEINFFTELDPDFTLDYTGDKYHLLSLAFKYYKTDTNGYNHFEILIFLDGILEGTINKTTHQTDIISLNFNKESYRVNCIDVVKVQKRTLKEDNPTRISNISEIDVARGFYAYRFNQFEPITAAPEYEIYTKIAKNFNDPNSIYLNDHKLLELSLGDVKNLSDSAPQTPKLFLKFSSTEESILEQIVRSYKPADETFPPKDCDVSYLSPGKKIEEGGDIPYTKETDYSFKFSIQGTSTKKNKSKNFELSVEGKQGTNLIPVYSPNFDPNDKTTFLPEQSFTLKADVVDSSHSNNTGLGHFVNDNLIYGSEGDFGSIPKYFPQTIRDHKYASHVKTCLRGYPVLLFFEFDKQLSEDKIETHYYYMGIYNFNLGRNSIFNLGYSSLENINFDSFIESTGGLTLGRCTTTQSINKFVTAEIQQNNGLWDFSQFHESILFKSETDKNDNGYMLGDYDNSDTHSQGFDLKKSLQTFVNNITLSGGYLFNWLGKTQTEEPSVSFKYNEENKYANSLKQMYRYFDEGKNTYIIEEFKGDFPKDLIKPTQDTLMTEDYLRNCIIQDENNTSEDTRYLMYESCVYYYTLVMAFGMVDSVQKNLTVKTWNGRTYGLFCYDMDTSIGLSNTGGKVDPFCFSDYWQTDENNLVTIKRDYCPDKVEGWEGKYDIPSSYLFAIAKYAASKLNSNKEEGGINLIHPNRIWTKWRAARNDDATDKSIGVLRSAEDVLNEYFSDIHNNVPAHLISLNYRTKYLFHPSGEAANVPFVDKNDGIVSFRGTQRYFKKKWLEDRFRMMDSYLNLLSQTRNLVGEFSEACFKQTDDQRIHLDNNEDNIPILQDMFKTSKTEASPRYDSIPQNSSLVISTLDYTPLSLQTESSTANYLLLDKSKSYTVYLPTLTSSEASFLGSRSITEIDSIGLSNLLGKRNEKSVSLTIKNPNLRKLELNSDNFNHKLKVGERTLELPKVEILALKGPKLIGNLNIDESFKRLEDLDLTQAEFESVTINNPYIRSLKIDWANIGELNIGTNCINLTEFTFTHAKIGTLNVQRDLNIDYTFGNEEESKSTVRVLTLHGGGGNTLEYISAYDLTELEITGFKKINVANAHDLTSFTITELENEHTLEYLRFSEVNLYNNGKGVNLSDFDNLKTALICWWGGTKPAKLVLPSNKTKLTTFSIIGWRYIELNDNNTLDLSEYLNLKQVETAQNYSIETLKVRNEVDNPVSVPKGFHNMTKLKYISGSFILEAATTNSSNYEVSGYFCGCSELDLFHEKESLITDLKWNNKSVYEDFRCNTPWELLGLTTSNLDSKSVKENWASFYNSSHEFNLFIGHSTENLDSSSGTSKCLNNLFSSPSNDLNQGKFSVFLSYYMMAAAVFSAIGNTDGNGIYFHPERKYVYDDTEYRPKNNSWYGILQGTFDMFGKKPVTSNLYSGPSWSYINPINRYIFYGFNLIWPSNQQLNLALTFRGQIDKNSVNGTIKIEDGILEPFSKINDQDHFISSYTWPDKCIVSKDHFQNFTDKPLYLSGFKPVIIVDDYISFENKYGIQNRAVDKLEKLLEQPSDLEWFIKNTGNISALFQGLAIKSLEVCFSETTKLVKLGKGLPFSDQSDGENYMSRSFFDVPYIVFTGYEDNLNENSLSLELKDIIADGEARKFFRILGPNYFRTKNLVKETEFYHYYNDVINKLDTVKLILNKDTFSNYSSLEIFGRDRSASAIDPLKYIPFGIFHKVIDLDLAHEYYNILSKDQRIGTGSSDSDPLTTVVGLFQEAELSDTYNVEFPGDLFKNTPNLKDIERFFKNVKFKYTLTPEGFKNCPNLTNVSELFYQDAGLYKSESEVDAYGPFGKIPFKLLYHGGTDKSMIYINADSLDTTMISYEEVNANIENAESLFYGCNLLTGCKESSLPNSMTNYYTNPSYIPYEHYTTNLSSQVKTRPNEPKYTKKYDITWSTDGLTEYDRSDLYCEEDYTHIKHPSSGESDWIVWNSGKDKQSSISSGNSEGVMYLCPPDIFRFCKNDTTLNIKNCFAYCGVGVSSTDSNRKIFPIESIKDFRETGKLPRPAAYEFLSMLEPKSRGYFERGLSGRIPTQLFSPINHVTDLTGIFKFCKKISEFRYQTITEEGNTTYSDTTQIPIGLLDGLTNLTSIKQMFQGCAFSRYTSLKVLNKNIQNSLDVTGLFSQCIYQPSVDTDSNNWQISDIFSGTPIKSATGIFCEYYLKVYDNLSPINFKSGLYPTSNPSLDYYNPYEDSDNRLPVNNKLLINKNNFKYSTDSSELQTYMFSYMPVNTVNTFINDTKGAEDQKLRDKIQGQYEDSSSNIIYGNYLTYESKQ